MGSEEPTLTPYQIIGGIVGAAGAVAAVLQAVPDPSDVVTYAALVCTVVAAAGGGFLAAVSGTPGRVARYVATKLPRRHAEERLKAGLQP